MLTIIDFDKITCQLNKTNEEFCDFYDHIN